MNLFFLDQDFETNARYHVNSHCIKIILESAQCLSAAHWLNNSQAPYKLTHKNHPTSIWCRSSVDNYLWACKYGKALCKEYTYRYRKSHKTEEYIDWFLKNAPDLPDIGPTKFYCAMPDHCKLETPILSYRNYYNTEKRHLMFDGRMAGWKNREVPYWVTI